MIFEAQLSYVREKLNHSDQIQQQNGVTTINCNILLSSILNEEKILPVITISSDHVASFSHILILYKHTLITIQFLK